MVKCGQGVGQDGGVPSQFGHLGDHFDVAAQARGLFQPGSHGLHVFHSNIGFRPGSFLNQMKDFVDETVEPDHDLLRRRLRLQLRRSLENPFRLLHATTSD